jgi:NADP-dependent aldehyde dehydrogenase
MTLHGKSLIAGQAGQAGGRIFRAVNPATNTALEPEFHEANPTEVTRVLDEAAVAFSDYRTRSGADRAKFLETIASEIEALGDALLQRAVAETGLPRARITGERGRTCGQLRLFGQVVRDGSWVDARIDPASPTGNRCRGRIFAGC